MKNLFFKKLHKFSFLLILAHTFYQYSLLNAQEKIIHSLPLKKQFFQGDNSNKNLTPMPEGDIINSSSKVNFDRNPFQEPLENEFTTIENLYSSLKFRGLAKSKDKILAIIETDNGQKFYKVGDSLENGFVIQLISIEDLTVDISNGSKNYRLTLATLEKLI